MLKDIEKSKNSKAAMAIPENGIDFDFFVFIAGYVKLIDKSKYLRELFYGPNCFNNSNPHNLLIERGRSVSDCKQNKTS